MNIPIKPDYELFTESQWQAIHLSGTNILVSASAGSGKTTVLTRRIIEKLKQGVRIDQLLVCTFTDAATLEMKERIEKAIKKEINQQYDAGNDKLAHHLQDQLTLLPQAYISTIHGFCSKLITQHFEAIHLDPVFQMLTDDTQILMLKERVYEQIVEEWFDDESFLTLMKSYSAKRTDDKFLKLVLDLYDFSRAKSNPEAWLDELATLYDVDDITSSLLYQEVIKPMLLQQVSDCVMTIKQAIDVLNGETVVGKLTHLLEEDKAFYEQWLTMLEDNVPYQHVYHFVTQFSFPRMVTKMKDTEHLQDEIALAKSYRDEAKKQANTLIKSVFFADEKTQLTRLKQILPVVNTLARVVKLFAQRYLVEKQADNLVDYSDLEHYALNILMPLQHDGTRELSVIAQYYQNHFHEIMVDEYQDVNRMQESIIQAVANGRNVFMVGDVKQSIYAFRLADPTLFLEKYDAYAKDDANGVRIILKENFRSRRSVVQGVNFIFQQLMDKHLSGMDYDEHAMLVQGKAYPNDDNVDMSVLVFETEQDEDNDDELDSVNEGEIHSVAKHLQQLLNDGFSIMDGDKPRPATYRDVVLLAPTKKNNVLIKEIFETYDIPVIIQESDNYFKRTEMMIMLALLRVIDNPYQDIPLAAVLRSPLVNLTDSQLAAIRINDRTSDYYRAMLSFVSSYRQGEVVSNAFHDELYSKLMRFIEYLTQWRDMATKGSLVDLIWDIYDKTLFLDYVCGLPGGKQRQANLHALYDTAKSYEKTRFKGLFQFVQFIEKMQERQQDIAQVPILTGGENAVRVMTIHASKGLEFPVVYVLDLAKQFNFQDIKGDVVFTEKYGVGTYYFDVVNKWKYDTLAHTASKWFKQRQLLAEEMRKLYVALTRAKEKLVIVGRVKNKQHFFERQAFLQTYTDVFLPQAKREKSRVTAFDWISMALVRHKHHKNDYMPEPYIPQVLVNHPAQFSYTFYTLQDVLDKQVVKQQTQRATHSEDDRPFVTQTHLNLMGQYAFTEETKTTSYQAVSELKRLIEDPAIRELTTETTYRHVTNAFAIPKFMQQHVEVTSAMVGTATHLLLQTLDLKQTITMNVLRHHVDSLVAKGLITSEIVEKINYWQILRFFQTPFAKMLQENESNVRVEVPFSLIVSAKELFHHVTDDSDVLIHGIIDGYVEMDDGIILYDYKTDYIGENVSVNDVITRYRTQLNTYAKALVASTKKPVKHAYMILLSSGDIVDILDKSND